MASAARLPFVTIDEYLHTSYRPDVEYVDGLLQERNLGEFDHSDLQWAVLEAINAFQPSLGIRARPELRVQVAATRFRVPDVCVLSAGWQKTQIVIEPPLLCVEILSPEDRMSSMLDRCGDYLRMGVPAVWVLNPRTRTCTVVDRTAHREHTAGLLTLPTTTATIDLAALFQSLNAD